ncbi:hypothetical protein FKW31_02965 [Acetobacter sp. DmW_136]|uniref:hypothetical protein n=1 Tax=Acetobacter sp. DmW_136 TaxID=2591091 RepID=UPI00123A0335|nr:hypothetical protein [Acetobacter sp. DmW_136]KAA8387622.1 hypothetical protein FKW31_02965 [Acetobacter sp. DmW_136]
MSQARRGAAKPAVLPAQDEKKPAPVQAVRLLWPFGFIEEEFNRGRFEWSAGEVVSNPAEIELLRSRGAPLETA